MAVGIATETPAVGAAQRGDRRHLVVGELEAEHVEVLALPLRVGGQPAEWSPDEVYIALPRAGGDGWISIDRGTGAVEYERTDRGWVSYLNDLHKGRNTGAAWRWFIDVFALGCVVFSVTRLFLLYFHARQRRLTWPLVGLGLLIPLLIALLFVH